MDVVFGDQIVEGSIIIDPHNPFCTRRTIGIFYQSAVYDLVKQKMLPILPEDFKKLSFNTRKDREYMIDPIKMFPDFNTSVSDYQLFVIVNKWLKQYKKTENDYIRGYPEEYYIIKNQQTIRECREFLGRTEKVLLKK